MNTRHTQATPENKAAKADEPGGEHEHVFCCRVCGLEPMSAPDRAEELARLRATIVQVLCRRIKHIGGVDQLYTGYPNQLIDELVTAVASLLREEMGRE